MGIPMTVDDEVASLAQNLADRSQNRHTQIVLGIAEKAKRGGEVEQSEIGRVPCEVRTHKTRRRTFLLRYRKHAVGNVDSDGLGHHRSDRRDNATRSARKINITLASLRQPRSSYADVFAI